MEVVMTELKGKNVVVLGGSRGVGRLVVEAARAAGARVLAVARGEAALKALTRDLPGVESLVFDASNDKAPQAVFDVFTPDILVQCAGAIPPTQPVHELTWEQFSLNWQADVKTSFLFSQAALRAPLKPGAVVIFLSSGAALGGSPISGGYAGAKRAQMFMANYAQKESDRLGLGIRFLALAPARIMPETELGTRAVDGYARYLGIPAADFVKGMSAPQSARDAANAVIELATHPKAREGNVFMISGKGIEAVP